MAKVSVVGCEWVGLTIAAGMARLGHEVVAYDMAERALDELGRDICALGEPLLPDLIDTHMRTGRLRLAVGLQAAVADAEIHLVCDPATTSDGDGIESALDTTIERMLAVIPDGSIIVLVSSVAVGTADRLRSRVAAGDGRPHGVAVVTCPVFMKRGSAIADFLEPEQVVLGAESPRAAQRVAALFGCLAERLLFMSNRSAEATALVSGAFEAVATSFADSIAGLCEAVGADVNDVGRALPVALPAAQSPRPGSGVVGERRVSELAALAQLARRHGTSSRLFDAAIESQHERIEQVANDVLRTLGPLAIDGSGRRSATVGVWGLTCSGVTGREASPAMAVVDRLLDCGLDVQAFDPAVPDGLADGSEVTFHRHPYAAAAGADVLVVLSDWESFDELSLTDAVESMTRPLVVDARQTLVTERANPTQRAVEVLR